MFEIFRKVSNPRRGLDNFSRNSLKDLTCEAKESVGSFESLVISFREVFLSQHFEVTSDNTKCVDCVYGDLCSVIE